MLFDQSLALVFPIIMIGDIGKKKSMCVCVCVPYVNVHVSACVWNVIKKLHAT